MKITAGNVDDRDPVLELAHSLFGKLLGDRGYISQPLFEQLWEQGVQLVTLVTKVRKNMKNKLLPLFDKLLLRKRSIIETVNDQLKNISQIEHSRHRSPFSRPCKIHPAANTDLACGVFTSAVVNLPLIALANRSNKMRKKAVFSPRRTIARSSQRRL
ncbi:Transposase DDE domain-containing protein [Nitrosomonas sp. Nm58]|nr:Transposase DDE domain-containing protein [Nitrosomonas sp. Nm58]